MNDFVAFDAVYPRVIELLDGLDSPPPPRIPALYVVRDLFGRVRLSVSESVRHDAVSEEWLKLLARTLHDNLGVRSYPPQESVLVVDQEVLDSLEHTAQEIRPRVYWADRLVTGHDWWTVRDSGAAHESNRFALYSVKGGVGRSTTTAVLAWHLTGMGERVLVVDLDLESPGLSSAMLDDRERPEFGVTDWFVEDLVGQDTQVLEHMTASPGWARDFEGELHVAPAHGRQPGEYLAKLGRIHMDAAAPWSNRLERLLQQLEASRQPTIVLLESRSGLHEIAAATVTDLDAKVLLFATDASSTWDDYGILFRHWQQQGLATSIREKLYIVSALTPGVNEVSYLDGFRERSWNLFREHLYDEAVPFADPVADLFSFDLGDEHAPHDPFRINWNQGLAAGTSLRNLEQTSVTSAYTEFLKRFEQIIEPSVE